MRRAAFDKPVLSPVEGPVTSTGSVRSLSEVEACAEPCRSGLTRNGYVTVILKRITRAVYFFRAPRLSLFLLFFCFRISSWFNGPPGPYSFLCCWISSTKSIGSFDGTLNVHHVCPLSFVIAKSPF